MESHSRPNTVSRAGSGRRRRERLTAGPVPEGELSATELLDLFLETSPARRRTLFLTVTEAADWADVDRHTIRVWIREGRLSGYREAGRYFVLQESLRRVVESALP